MPALRQSASFLELLESVGESTGPVRGAWPLLYKAAEDIGVNISALKNQMTLEGLIIVESEGGKSVVYVQPALLTEDMV